MDDVRGHADVWLARGGEQPQVAVVGLPWSQHSGIALAPLALRDRLSRFSTFHSERQSDVAEVRAFDMGNWPVLGLDLADLQGYLSSRIDQLRSPGLTFFLGGDDAICQAIRGAMRADLLRFSSNRLAEEEQLGAVRTVTIGAHGFARTPKDRPAEPGTTFTHEQIEDEGMGTIVDRALGELESQDIHVSIDLDALDPSLVPGSRDAMPGGLVVRQLAEGVRLCAASPKVSSIDFVGADVQLDESGRTLDVSCHLLLTAVMGFRERM